MSIWVTRIFFAPPKVNFVFQAINTPCIKKIMLGHFTLYSLYIYKDIYKEKEKVFDETNIARLIKWYVY